ncbi:MAG: murein biosynthesis integral membrane protein MurJ [Phycisphaerae bacterium]|nr:murein biosynthesis integral membrane protein MurJ [Phycisphaerae bacterium]
MAEPTEDRPAGRGFERHALTVTMLTAASRLGGLAREACFSRIVGLTDVASAFGFAFMVPNLFRRLFGEGALSAALIPEQARLEKRHPAVAGRLATVMLLGLGLGLAAIVVLGELLLLMLGPGGGLGWRLLAIMLPYMPLVCITAIAGAVLQVRGRFTPAAAAPILLNLVLVASLLIAWSLGEGPVGERRIGIVAWAVVLAGVLQAAWTIIELRRTSPAVNGHVDPRMTGLRVRSSFRRVFKQSIPMMIGLGVLQLNTFLDGLIASWPTFFGPTILGHPYPLDDTAMATLGYAHRLYEFPLGVFGIAIATAIFPQLAREVGTPSAFAATIRRGIRLTIFIGVPASIGVILVRRPFAQVVLFGGAFDADDVRKVAFVLLGYATAIWSYSATHLLVRAFYARREPMTAVRIAVAMVGLNVILNIALVFGTGLGVAGLAWSTAICAIIQTFVLLRILERRTERLLDGEVVRSVVETVLSSIVMLVLVMLVLAGIQPLLPGDGWWSALVELSAATAVGVIVHLALSRWRRRPELGWALGRSG